MDKEGDKPREVGSEVAVKDRDLLCLGGNQNPNSAGETEATDLRSERASGIRLIWF